jgi:hypothetical protein
MATLYKKDKRRPNNERRKHYLTIHFPDRRSGRDRRTGKDDKIDLHAGKENSSR